MHRGKWWCAVSSRWRDGRDAASYRQAGGAVLPVGRPGLGVNAHFALNQGWSIDDERKPSLATKGSVLCLFAWSPPWQQCVWLYSSEAYIRMARSLWFLPTFYNFPREMLCASGPNLQKQFKHQRLLLLLSCFIAELPVKRRFSLLLFLCYLSQG